MIPIDRVTAERAIRRMSDFHGDALQLFIKHGMDILGDPGRRNNLLSIAQEKFFSDELRSRFDVLSDGSPGQPDIVVTDPVTGERTEIECKLTSRSKHGGTNFQTDYYTLVKKQVLDYLYVVADSEFSSFCVLYYKGLTPDDFRPPAEGSRGKASMIKHRAQHKCTPIIGAHNSLNRRNIERIVQSLTERQPPHRERRLVSSLDFWRSAPERFEVTLEEIHPVHAAEDATHIKNFENIAQEPIFIPDLTQE